MHNVMPRELSDRWICHSCRILNDAGVSSCTQCGCLSRLSSQDFGLRSFRQINTSFPGAATQSEAEAKSVTSTTENVNADAATKSGADAVGPGLFAFGLYLLAGAYVSISNGKWPWFMPPQLDFVAAIGEIWGTVSAAYIAGTVTGLLGVLFITLAVWCWRSEA